MDVDIFYRWILSDHLGSANVTLGADGIAERQTTFKPFGEVHQGDVGAGWGDAVFAGHPSQWVLGLVYLRARWQNPETGSFVSVDPVVADASAPESYNAYMYVENNPVGFIDPSGMIGVATFSTWINQNPGGMTEFVFTASRSGSGGGRRFLPRIRWWRRTLLWLSGRLYWRESVRWRGPLECAVAATIYRIIGVPE